MTAAVIANPLSYPCRSCGKPHQSEPTKKLKKPTHSPICRAVNPQDFTTTNESVGAVSRLTDNNRQVGGRSQPMASRHADLSQVSEPSHAPGGGWEDGLGLPWVCHGSTTGYLRQRVPRGLKKKTLRIMPSASCTSPNACNTLERNLTPASSLAGPHLGCLPR